MVVPCTQISELVSDNTFEIVNLKENQLTTQSLVTMTESSDKSPLNESVNDIFIRGLESSKNSIETEPLDLTSNCNLYPNGKKKSKIKDGHRTKNESFKSFEACQRSFPFPQGFLLTPFCTPPDLFLSHSPMMEVLEAPTNLLTNSEWDQLSADVWECCKKNQQSESMYRNKMALWKYLFVFIKSVYPTYGLYVVGSTLSGFGVNRSDVDMCLLVRQKDLGRERCELVYLNNILDVLTDVEFISKLELVPAKVPLLKFIDEERELEVDLNCNSLVGIRNTHLLFCYSQLDDRVKPLVITVKVWAHIQGINDARNGTISSYSLTLMVIHFLQCGVDPPVLPCLHKVYPDKFRPDLPITKINIHETLPPYRSCNQMPLGKLLLHFFEYFSNFEYLTYAMSVREGTVLTVSDCLLLPYPRSLHTQWNYICVEEPFEITNTARAVYDASAFQKIRYTFVKSAEILTQTRRLESILKSFSE